MSLQAYQWRRETTILLFFIRRCPHKKDKLALSHNLLLEYLLHRAVRYLARRCHCPTTLGAPNLFTTGPVAIDGDNPSGPRQQDYRDELCYSLHILFGTSFEPKELLEESAWDDARGNDDAQLGNPTW